MSAQIKFSFLVVCSFAFYFLEVNSAYCMADEDNVKDFCANPVPPKSSLDVKWLHEHFEQGWAMQFGNSVMRKRMTSLIRGKDVTKEEEYSEMCARVKLDYVENHSAGVFSGYGGKEAFFNCTEDTGYDCTFTSSDRLTQLPVRAYATYFDDKGKDGHNIICAAMCFENGDLGWYVLSISETISDEEKKTITEHLKSIGFNPDLQVPFRTSSC